VADDEGARVVDLVAAALAGEIAAWEEIVERYGPLVMSVLARYRVFGPDAEDVSQVVWARLVEHLGDLREPRALPKWLIVTTQHECVTLLRGRSRVQPVERVEELAARDNQPELDENLLRAERTHALLEAFAGLSDPHRDLLLLLLSEPPLSYVEISERLGIPVGSIGPTRARLLSKLRSSPALAGLIEANRDVVDEGGDKNAVRTMA
jgi:RNA polymerase sigma factor (sigma-70 family)